MSRLSLSLLLAWFISFVQAQPAGTEGCAQCHGDRGQGNAAMATPPLAGQPPAYLERQLEAYATGLRENQLMTPIAKSLSPEQRTAFAQHYAGLTPPRAAESKVQGDIGLGRRLAVVGDENRRVQACQNCHGPGSAGMLPATPYLTGLGAKYLQATLQAWRSGARNTDPSSAMHVLAAHLSDAEIAALTAYYAQLLPPRVAVAQRGGRTVAAAGKATPTQPGAGETPAAGVGAGGGEPTTGGSQGPGGGGATKEEVGK